MKNYHNFVCSRRFWSKISLRDPCKAGSSISIKYVVTWDYRRTREKHSGPENRWSLFFCFEGHTGQLWGSCGARAEHKPARKQSMHSSSLPHLLLFDFWAIPVLRDHRWRCSRNIFSAGGWTRVSCEQFKWLNSCIISPAHWLENQLNGFHFGVMPSGAQSLLLALHLGIIPCGAQGPYETSDWTWVATCKASTCPLYYLSGLGPNF